MPWSSSSGLAINIFLRQNPWKIVLIRWSWHRTKQKLYTEPLCHCILDGVHKRRHPQDIFNEKQRTCMYPLHTWSPVPARWRQVGLKGGERQSLGKSTWNLAFTDSWGSRPGKWSTKGEMNSASQRRWSPLSTSFMKIQWWSVWYTNRFEIRLGLNLNNSLYEYCWLLPSTRVRFLRYVLLYGEIHEWQITHIWEKMGWVSQHPWYP